MTELRFTLNDVAAEGWFDLLKPEDRSTDSDTDSWSIMGAYRTDAAVTQWLDMVDKEAVPQAEYYSDTVLIVKAEFDQVEEATFPYSDDNFLIVTVRSSSGYFSDHRFGVNGDGESISTATSAEWDFGQSLPSARSVQACDETCVPGLDLFAFDATTEATVTQWTVAKALLNSEAIDAEDSTYDDQYEEERFRDDLEKDEEFRVLLHFKQDATETPPYILSFGDGIAERTGVTLTGETQAADGGALVEGAINSFAQTFSALVLAVLAVSSF